jgi:catechol 2,3-dioxygenase-like lactoylglutathione lyase family enzyme|tara:strand:- start:66 stop:437 length:372 start_codon:yes stop_codon:yes gene_type:complete
MKIDHLVLTVKDISKAVHFYENYLGFKKETSSGGRIALKFTNGKINLHQYGNEFEPKAAVPTPGSADLCFVADKNIADLMSTLVENGVEIIKGPVIKIGSQGEINSFYIRDPDNNLIEISNYV